MTGSNSRGDEGMTMQPTDEELIEYLAANPARSLAHLCAKFGLLYMYSETYRSPSGRTWGYTDSAQKIRAQLQHLRKIGKIESMSGRWYAR
jgi:hypothetical protein